MMSPKERFLAHPTEVSIHKSLVVSPPFLNASDTAIMQMAQQLSEGAAVDIQTAAANFHKIAGAIQYRKTLLTLADTPTVPKRTNPGTLDNV